MKEALLVIQIIISFLLVGAILLQSQGTGLGSVWGGGGESYHTKRGVEKVMVYLSIVLIALFAIVTVSSSILV